jgi:hypothetical protein
MQHLQIIQTIIDTTKQNKTQTFETNAIKHNNNKCKKKSKSKSKKFIQTKRETNTLSKQNSNRQIKHTST